MSKTIWIINEYAGTPYHGMEYRHYYLAKELIKLDYEVTVVSSSYPHLFKNLPKKRKENKDKWLVYDVEVIGISILKADKAQFREYLKTKTKTQLMDELSKK